MTSGAALFSLLSTYPAVTAIVGSGAAARIYPDLIPYGVDLPAVVYDESSVPVSTISGQVYGRISTLTVACWAESRSEADALADAVESAFLSIKQPWDGRENAADGDTGNCSAILTQSWLV